MRMDLPYIYGQPTVTGRMRARPEDFIVSETLSFTPTGEGEHVFLQIRKTGENTDTIARQLTRYAGIGPRDIGFAGLKDRHAVATQWFSLWLPGKDEPDWTDIASPTLRILQSTRHARKLKRGAIAHNRFEITLRDVDGDSAALVERLRSIKTYGIANYFGEQRFGHECRNVEKALAMFRGMKVKREQRSLYLSAARSHLFNLILAERVNQNTWNRAIDGDVFMIDGSQSCFKANPSDSDISERIGNQTVHPAGVLWGKGDFDAEADAFAIEQSVLETHEELAQGLIANGLEKSRRSFRVNVDDLDWQFMDDTTLKLDFSLPSGSYATALVRELIDSQPL